MHWCEKLHTLSPDALNGRSFLLSAAGRRRKKSFNYSGLKHATLNGKQPCLRFHVSSGRRKDVKKEGEKQKGELERGASQRDGGPRAAGTSAHPLLFSGVFWSGTLTPPAAN